MPRPSPSEYRRMASTKPIHTYQKQTHYTYTINTKSKHNTHTPIHTYHTHTTINTPYIHPVKTYHTHTIYTYHIHCKHTQWGGAITSISGKLYKEDRCDPTA